MKHFGIDFMQGNRFHFFTVETGAIYNDYRLLKLGYLTLCNKQYTPWALALKYKSFTAFKALYTWSARDHRKFLLRLADLHNFDYETEMFAVKFVTKGKIENLPEPEKYIGVVHTKLTLWRDSLTK